MDHYSYNITERPLRLTERERTEMRRVFDAVMAPLAFFARPAFLERLFDTDTLIRVRTKENELVAFGSAVERTLEGRRAVHIIAMYVIPDYRRHAVMKRAVALWLLHYLVRHPRMLLTGLVLTGSAVNPQVVHALAKYCSVWPDLRCGTPPPSWAVEIAEISARQFYPVQTGVPFQVQITDEYAGIRDLGTNHATDDATFDERFHEIACPREFKLLFFVAEIRLSGIIKALWASRPKSQASVTSGSGRGWADR